MPRSRYAHIFGVIAVACGARSQLDGSAAGSDAQAPDSIAADSSDSEQCPGASWSSLADSAKWSTFDIATVNPKAGGFEGSVFDGRYLYLVPYAAEAPATFVARYDTTAPFGSAGAWATFDLTTVNVYASALMGGTFDGRYVYFAPGSGVFLRYDPTLDFTTPTSWTVLLTSASGVGGAAFDGRYVYLVPGSSGVITRYDTTSALITTFDFAAIEADVKEYLGAAFDGRYVYFAPATNGIVARFDTTAPLTTAGAWATFDLSTTNIHASGFVGAVFDGRYVYFVPHDDGTFDGIVARYDTGASFTAADAWATFDVTTVNSSAQGFAGGAFDGRYVYLVPWESGLVARLDTTGTFADGSAWTTFDIASVNPSATGFFGAAFDGRYIYLVPNNNGVVARFDALSSPCPLAHPTASFF